MVTKQRVSKIATLLGINDEPLADARAEILRIKHCESAASDMLAAREALIEQQRTEIEQLREGIRRAHDGLSNQNKLIEQMRRAIEKMAANFRVNLRDLTEFEGKQVRILEAAIEAAERGE